ncbi:hypothetical protein O181_058100 [Austropuccinia psidii MF-1]|uniref:Uncharacterized protein n=1 Tax=Austropuccinia psidii MF-1 TaxID=1389203 RepID=A0A9Q3E914_9BASI|nr:hypothetical protein [Austropuccinia psidii MF-1]
MKAWGLVRWKLPREANDGRIWPGERYYDQKSLEHQRGPIGHKRYGVANFPQLGFQAVIVRHQLRRVSQPHRMTLLHLVLRQFQPENQVGANWPPHIFYGQLAPSGALWPFGHSWPQAISCNQWPPWPISTTPTPRPLSLFLGLGVPFVFQEVLGPLAITIILGPRPFIKGFRA